MVKAFVQLLEGANEIKYQCDFIVYLFFEVTISETEVYDVENGKLKIENDVTRKN